MAEKTLKSVFVDELRDLYNAEQQLIKALPKMAKTATSEELRKGFEEHLEQTKEHAARIEKILSGLGEPVKGKKCKGMEGIVAEGSEVMSEDYEGAVMDAALLLEQTLKEEKETDQKLTDLSKEINQEAYQGGTGEEGETKPRQRAAKAGTNR
jgi:ferritin-like metal-binding protein YciE